MSTEPDLKEPGNRALAGQTVHIISEHMLYSEALSNVLESKAGVRCRCVKSFEDIPESAINGSQPEFFLFDLLGQGFEEFLAEFLTSAEKIADSQLVVMYNVRPGVGIEESCMNHGLRGIFYENDNLSVFLKGICAIYSGELWFSRGAMTKFILEDKDSGIVSMKVRSILTHREIEIISLVAVGCRNEEVAEKLCVSPHTIKTHLYNIYKKINVTNRLQATLWAANNL